MNKPLCYAPFLGMYSVYDNKYAPCCVAKKEKFDSPDDYWNSEHLKKIRKQLLNNEWPDACIYCKSRRENNIPDETEEWNKLYNELEIEISIADGNINKSPVMLDYRPSNECNLKCRMCSPNFSNKWNSEVTQHEKLREWLNPKIIKENNFEYFLKYIENTDLKLLKILGGEPTIDNNTLIFLEKIVESSTTLPKLRITTNGTNFNKRFKDLMFKFDKISMAFSIDATDKTFEYIRTNSNWKKVKKNIENIFKTHKNIHYGFNIVLMPYNIFNITDLLDWLYTFYQKKYDFHLYFTTSDVYFTSINALLPEDKEYLLSTVEAWLSKHQDFINDIEGLGALLPIIKSSQYSEKAYKTFKSYNNTLDEIRKTSLIELDKNFTKYI